ncbi:MAG TPA: hypothetical protein VGG67_09865, partial [Steroidobacteraceae bacterium]
MLYIARERRRHTLYSGAQMCPQQAEQPIGSTAEYEAVPQGTGFDQPRGERRRGLFHKPSHAARAVRQSVSWHDVPELRIRLIGLDTYEDEPIGASPQVQGQLAQRQLHGMFIKDEVIRRK